MRGPKDTELLLAWYQARRHELDRPRWWRRLAAGLLAALRRRTPRP